MWPEPAAGSGAGVKGQRAPKFVIECKVLHKSLDRTIRDIRDGLEQTAAYVDRCAAEVGHLVIFDRRAGNGRGRTRCSTGASRRVAWTSTCGACDILVEWQAWEYG